MELVNFAAHITPLVLFLLVFVWMAFVMTSYTLQPDGTIVETSLAGFSWADKSDLVFNWHPVLMAFGFLFCCSQAILVFVTKPFSHATNKLIHIACHSVSILSVMVGTIAIFRFHNEHGFHNLHSVHSWVGLTTLVLFGAQYTFGIVVYWFPGAPVPFRKQSMPYHIAVGLGAMGLITITFVSGILEQLSFNASCDVTGTFHGSITAVSIAILFLALLLVVYVSKHPVDLAILQSCSNMVMGSVMRTCSYVLPFVVVVLVLVWMGSTLMSYTVNSDDTVEYKSLAGFSWAPNDGRVFNWHPVLMTFGLLFCSSQAILVFVTKPYSHHINKRIHVVCHTLAILSVIVGLVAVIRFHNEHDIKNIYSLHSWIGLFTLLLVVGQYALGFLSFFYPGVQVRLRMMLVPYHIGLGVGIVALVGITAVAGVMEKLMFNRSCNLHGTLDGMKVKGFQSWDCLLGNTIGLLIVAAVAALVTSIYLSKHTPSDAMKRS
ncbi:hypothetical protein H310_00067 [Aphanomyces invadans]|uniref:Cytochrome b561 domain-containing protein n=1 Tax=Aphanomyces invadans TaxID=157072 RepID=A0A024UT39_9STRA|nr:hypothetical protein H310_00067 [Aphanomyces invadans]ETW09499.1 hypothetical protein H310_00067 [Aphanomyces invadans]|eukprot:XP_008860910.1 hypothetical protein H310_00067 [Aphanomyces invadans]